MLPNGTAKAPRRQVKDATRFKRQTRSASSSEKRLPRPAFLRCHLRVLAVQFFVLPAGQRRHEGNLNSEVAKTPSLRREEVQETNEIRAFTRKRTGIDALFFAVILASSRLGCSVLRSSRWPAAARRESEQRSCQDAKSKTRRTSRDKRDSRLHPKRDHPGRLFFTVIFASWLFNSSFFPMASGGTNGI